MSSEQPAGSARARSLSGVVIAGTGSAVPGRRVTNADLEKVMDTSDEWIVQRTGIRERHIHDRDAGESSASLATEAAGRALESAGLAGDQVDLLVCATMTPDMPTPSVSCIVADRIGAGPIPAFDLNAACSGFVYAMNTVHALMLGGRYKTALVIGVDCITQHCDFSTSGRATSVLFGDAGGACVLRASDDASKGLLAESMHSDGAGAQHLYIPSRAGDFYDQDDSDAQKINRVVMHGPGIFKFAVSTFPRLIEQTLDRAGLSADAVDHYICHQSNARILAAARERFGLAESKMHVNIDRFGNTVAASVPLILDHQTRAGRVQPGQKVMFLAFGAGLTWASSLWQL
ncbi:MAG: ketoacyl-ACP synthase III [Phycisphaerales bacterium]|nr:ketoacyl-ACP synthase III [Phycisphaerales bacterium]